MQRVVDPTLFVSMELAETAVRQLGRAPDAPTSSG